MNYQTYQQRPQHTPKKSSGGAKTCLILGLTGVALVALLMIIGVVGLVALGVSFRDAAEKRRADRMAELGIQPMPTPERVRPSRPAIRIEDIKDPKSITEAISMLNRSEYQYHVVAATWLAKQPVDLGQQARVSAALVEKTNRGTTQARNAAMDAFEKWAHPDSAGDFAKDLRPNNDGNARRLQLLTKLKRVESAEKIATLLESSVDGPEAKNALKAIGSDAVPFILPMLDSEKPLAKKYAKELLEDMNVDIPSAQAKRYAAMLTDDDSFNNDDAFQGLIGLDVISELQPQISKELSAALDKGGFNSADILKAMQKWGDQSCVPAVNRFLEKEAFLDNYPDLFKTINHLDDDSSIPILVGQLVEFASPSKRISDCLIGFGERAVPDVVAIMNHEDKNVQEGVKRFLTAVEVEDELLINQCLDDMKQGKEQVVSNAFAWMGRLEPDEIDLTDTRRNEIASAMAVGRENAYWTRKEEAAKVFTAWATELHAKELTEMLEDNDEKVWKPALEKLVAFNNPDVSARPVADLLTNFFKREKAIQVLRDAGPGIEDLAIVLIGGLEDDDALYEACDLLARYGGEKSLSPLNDLSKRAARKGGNDGKKIAQASKDAIQIIKERLAAQREREEGGDM